VHGCPRPDAPSCCSLTRRRGPLTRIRPRRGAPAHHQPHYRLADFLEEHGRTTRRLDHSPNGFWEALVDHAHRPDLTDLAQSAGERGLVSPALRLFTAAYEAGQSDGLRAVGTLLHRAGRIDDAIAWYQRANEAGDSASLGLAVTLLYDTGRIDEAMAWITQRANQGDRTAPDWITQLQSTTPT
jgi:TPR repeat protein